MIKCQSLSDLLALLGHLKNELIKNPRCIALTLIARPGRLVPVSVPRHSFRLLLSSHKKKPNGGLIEGLRSEGLFMLPGLIIIGNPLLVPDTLLNP